MPWKPGEKLTLLCIAELENAEEGYSYPSIATIAARTGQSVRTVSTHIKTLEMAGAIMVSKRERSSAGVWLRNAYHLSVPDRYRATDPEWMRNQG